jgi:PPP family 3-phenylpropionic acid transporter
MIFSSIFGFANFYMIKFGLISSEIGVIMAIGYIAAFFLQPIIASFSDSTTKFSLNQIILGFLFLLMICITALGFLTSQKYIIGAMFSILVALLFILQPLINSISGNFESHGIPINFGIARSMGSLFYAIVSYGVGRLINYFEPKVILVAATIFIGFMFISTLTLKIPHAKKEDEHETASDLLQFFKEYPHFIGIIFGVACLFFFHTISNVYMFQILSRYGGDSSDLGLTLGLAAVFEFPIIFLFSKIAKKISVTKLLKISGFFFMVKAIVLLNANSVFLIYAQQIFQAFAFAVFTPASVEYVNQSVAPKDRGKGQALMTTANTLGATISALVGGTILATQGVHHMLLIAAGVVSLGFIILLIFVRKPKKLNI